MIADVVNHAVAGIDFIHAVGGLFVRKGSSASTNTVMTQNGTTLQGKCREADISALAEAR
jgi:hypothetical protein